ncbi:diacylglycerol kinase [Spongiivirga citrea]|uniref:Diacylglycerol kinase family protein n=1 Tax=Spongiivirga citrea TaxID=1481457 RepID=A0A6M0CFY3_9FLAO|nr:diacylglycerol kinase family protein [Spongiivirga citrea]NER16758.1 diacylglycerol kinase family protein [Spongiivirga citrea]
MSNKDQKTYSKRFLGIQYALKGVFLLFKTERNFQIQFTIAIIMTGAGFCFKISTTEWLFQIIAISMVLSCEAMNTAFEKLADFIMPDHHDKIGQAKDIAAAAVFLTAIFAGVIGLIIYLPKLL